MQGGARCEVRGVLSTYAAAPRERANAADGPFSAACWVHLAGIAEEPVSCQAALALRTTLSLCAGAVPLAALLLSQKLLDAP